MQYNYQDWMWLVSQSWHWMWELIQLHLSLSFSLQWNNRISPWSLTSDQISNPSEALLHPRLPETSRFSRVYDCGTLLLFSLLTGQYCFFALSKQHCALLRCDQWDSCVLSGLTVVLENVQVLNDTSVVALDTWKFIVWFIFVHDWRLHIMNTNASCFCIPHDKGSLSKRTMNGTARQDESWVGELLRTVPTCTCTECRHPT
jgi:hypothetical protein